MPTTSCKQSSFQITIKRMCGLIFLFLMFGLIIYCLTCAEQIQGLASLGYNCQNSRLSWLKYQPYNPQDLMPYSS